MSASLRFRSLLCFLMCGCLLLCSCAQEVETVSVPPTPTVDNLQKMLTAMDKEAELVAEFESRAGVSALSLLKTTMGNGIYKEQVTLSQLSVMGTSYIGGEPVLLMQEKQIRDGALHTVGSLSASGDTIPYESLLCQDGEYLAFSQAEGGRFATDGTFSPTRFLCADIQEANTALQAVLTSEDITVGAKNGGTEYTAVLDQALCKKLGNSFGTAAIPQGNATLTVTVFVSDKSFDLRTVLQEGDLCLLQTSYTVTKADNTLFLTAKVSREGMLLLDTEWTAAHGENGLNLHGTAIREERQTEIDLLLATQADGGVQLSGGITLTLPENPSLSTVPFQINGTLYQAEEQLLLSAALETNIPGKLTLSATLASSFATGTPEIATDLKEDGLPTATKDTVAEFLRKQYPHGAELLDALFFRPDEPTEEVSSLTYRDEGGNLVLTLYGDGTAGLSLQGTFTMAENILTLSYGEHPLFSVPYTLNENGTYTIWNVTFSSYGDAYSYLSPDGTRWVELMNVSQSDGTVLFDLCLPATVTENTLEILMPDGSILPLPYQATQDGLTAWLWDIELKLVSGNSP